MHGRTTDAAGLTHVASSSRIAYNKYWSLIDLSTKWREAFISDIKHRVVRGSMWLGVANMLTKPLNIVGTLILARLLDPYDFGLVALSMLLVTSSYLFIDLGMGSALIQTTLERRRVVFPSFVITMLCGAVLTALIILFAAPLARFLGEPSATATVTWLAWMVFLQAAITIPESLLRKDLHFGQVSFLNFLQEFLNLVIAVVLAYLGYGVWSLVFGQLISALVQTALTWILTPGWDWLRVVPVDWSAIRRLLHYGVRSTSSGIISFLHQNSDDWLVGRVFGATSLGYYSKAYALTNNTLSGLSKNLINGVFMPYYAQMQQETVRLRRIYMKVLDFVLLMMAPLAAGFFITAPQLVSVLLGDKWLPVIPVFQVYALLIFTRPISSNTAPLFMAVGRPDYNLQAGIVLMAVMVPSILLLLPYNITGVALGVVIGHTVAAAFNVYQVNRLLPGTAWMTARSMVAPLVASVLMMGGVQLAKQPLLHLLGLSDYNLVALTLLVGLGALIYLAAAYMLQRDLLVELLRLSFSAFGGRRRRQQVTQLAPE